MLHKKQKHNVMSAPRKDDGFWNICSYKAYRIIFQQTGLGDKEILGGGSSMSKGRGTWVYSTVGHSKELRPLDSDT